MFTPAIHDAARAIEPSARGELEITDAIQHLVDTGKLVEPHIVQGWWKDTGRLDDMLEANRLILDRIEPRIDGELIDSQCDGRVVVEAGAVLERSTVRGPAIIGAGTRLVDATSAPTRRSARTASSSARRSSTRSCSPAPRVTGLEGRMESSLLGRNVRIAREAMRQPRAYRFLVGDNSDIGIL